MTRLLLPILALALVACSSSVETTSSNQAAASSGGESSGASGSEPTPTRTVATGAAPIAVPLPGVERAAMRPELQQLWTKIEDALAITPPDAPLASDEAEIGLWIEGPFSEWVRRRYQATQDAFAVAAHLTDITPVERGFAVALVAYAYEDMAASARGMPVPPAISNDPALIGVFAESIDRALLPIAEYAATGYDGCARLFTESADPAWSEWAPFCGQHLEDLREVFGRYARPEPAPSSASESSTPSSASEGSTSSSPSGSAPTSTTARRSSRARR